MSTFKRHDMSTILDQILVEAAKKEEKKPVDEKTKAEGVINRFKSPKHTLHVKKHLEKLEKGHAPKKVLKDFFKDLNKVSSADEIDSIMKEGSKKVVELAPGLKLTMFDTKDEMGYEISLKGTFLHSGINMEKVIDILRNAFKKIIN